METTSSTCLLGYVGGVGRCAGHGQCSSLHAGQLKPSPDKPPTPLDTRRVFVCFMRSAPIIMRRLMETRDKLGVDVSNVVVVAIPWKDTISSACSRCGAVVCATPV